MITILSTDQFDPSVQFLNFRQAIRHIADLSARSFSTDAFRARIQTARLGLVECSFIDSDPVVIERNLSNIERDKGNDYFLALQMSGTGAVRHLGRDLRLEPGDYSIFDSSLPYSIEVDGPVKRIVLRFPKAEFVRRRVATDTVCGRVFSGSNGASGLISRVVRALYTETTETFPDVGHSLASALIDLIADTQSEDGAKGQNSWSHDQLLKRIRMIALENLSDPELSVASIAEQVGISVRYLHRVFGMTGTTLHKWIESERLERAYHALKSPNHRCRTVQDVAFGNGFNDSGYFSQIFKRRFGVTPKQIRSE